MFIPGIGMSNPIDLSPMFASAHNGLEEMARQFQESGEKSSKAMVDMVNNSLHAPNELQSAISSGGILGILSAGRSDEHTSELQSLMRISYAVFCLQKKN